MPSARVAILYSAVLLAAAIFASGPALAELKLCNATSSRVGVAIGYQDQRGWASEGWWNIGAQTCEVLLKGAAPNRYIYVYAVDYERGGAWTGSQDLCIDDKSFTIRDNKDCEERGFQSGKFYEVDTGNASSWTIRLSEPESNEAEQN